MALGSIPSLSPAVNFREIDLTGVVPNNPTSTAVIAGNFNWGPILEPVMVANETELVTRFGKPNASNTIDWHGASYFLKYSDGLYVVRGLDDSAEASTAVNATAFDSDLSWTPSNDALVQNYSDFEVQQGTLDNYVDSSDRGHIALARYAGTLGNSLEVQICPASDSDVAFDAWDYKDEFDAAPGTSVYAAARDGLKDEAHVIVIDKNGQLTGTKGAILEKYSFVTVASDGKGADGVNNYIKDVVNTGSEYIYLVSFGSNIIGDADDWGASTTLGTTTTPGTPKTFFASQGVKKLTFQSGANASTLDNGDYYTAYETIKDPDLYSVDLIIAPGLSSRTDHKTLVNNLTNLAQTVRKNSLVVASPARSDVVGRARAAIPAQIVLTANVMTASSYLTIDGNYLKVYDRYNDQYIWIAASSSTAGIMAATDRTNGPWWSPAGTRRGQYLAITDIGFNPNKTDRDTLYKANVNPIVTFPQQGTLLFGDKTKLGRPSAFDRINVRRLFLKIEKDIIEYSKTILFEFNDQFTRSEFKAVVNPYLKNIKAQRGIYDYLVVCDETNNPPDVIDRNEFIASIFVKPARSINFITLNFVAVRTGASFEEVVGTI